MLELKNITKVYPAGGENVEALKGVSIRFRENEFVSVLGPSGCGKTTMLNIIGGLDNYTSGDLIINGGTIDVTGESSFDYDGTDRKEEVKKQVVVRDATTKDPLENQDGAEKYRVLIGDYNDRGCTDAGSYKVIVIGENGYTGTVTKTIKITPKKVKSFNAAKDLEKPYRAGGVTLTDEEIDIRDTIDGETYLLRQGVDYRVAYRNNKKAGSGGKTASYTVTFLGNYKGSSALKNVPFTILPASIEGAEVVLPNQAFKGTGIYAAAPYVVAADGTLLKNKTDYTVRYYRQYQDGSFTGEITKKEPVTESELEKSGLKTLTVYVQVTGKGNYGGADSTAHGSYLVLGDSRNPEKQANYRVSVKGEDGKALKTSYTGSAIEPFVRIEKKESGAWTELKTEEERKGLHILYANNVKKGKATVVVTGDAEGTLCGARTATFTITASTESKIK